MYKVVENLKSFKDINLLNSIFILNKNSYHLALLICYPYMSYYTCIIICLYYNIKDLKKNSSYFYDNCNSMVLRILDNYKNKLITDLPYISNYIKD